MDDQANGIYIQGLTSSGDPSKDEAPQDPHLNSDYLNLSIGRLNSE